MPLGRRDFLIRTPLAATAFSSAGRSQEPSAYFPPPDNEGGWRTLHDASSVRKVAGMDLETLDRSFEYTKTTSRFGGLLVARHGYLVYEKYFGRASREVTPNMASCGKMFTSLCLGIVLDRNPVAFPDGLSQKVFTQRYLPGAFPLSDPRKADIQLGHLLTMTSGMADGNGNTGIVHGEDVKVESLQPVDPTLGQDATALRTSMWMNPGGGYCYSSQGAHVASIVLRHLVGMEMEEYIRRNIATAMQFGGWGYAMQRGDGKKLDHTPGGGGIALRATDALRFAYLLLRNGRWGNRQLVPSKYLALCKKPSPFNPHSPFSLQFEVNEDRHVAGAPPDAFFKSGAGGFCIYAVPSLELAVYKMSCIGLLDASRYDLGFSGKAENGDASRDNWKPHPFDQFHDGPINGDAGTRRTLDMVIASIRD
ncbi:MAG TPA: serine hydrolase [Bryobacteraceae bacterium]|jgi:CubicO group peptidase (beta-lactamase class C family)